MLHFVERNTDPESFRCRILVRPVSRQVPYKSIHNIWVLGEWEEVGGLRFKTEVPWSTGPRYGYGRDFIIWIREHDWVWRDETQEKEEIKVKRHETVEKSWILESNESNSDEKSKAKKLVIFITPINDVQRRKTRVLNVRNKK